MMDAEKVTEGERGERRTTGGHSGDNEGGERGRKKRMTEGRRENMQNKGSEMSAKRSDR